MPVLGHNPVARAGIHHFETIPDPGRKPGVHHPHRLSGFAVLESPVMMRSSAPGLRALAFD